MRKRLPNTVMTEMRYEIWRGDLRDHDTFKFWRDRWTALLKQLGSDQPLYPSEFLNQDKVTVLRCGEEIVGIHLIKEYERKEFRSAPYFTGYNRDFFSGLESRRIRRVQALQYFLVDEKWSVGNTLVNFGAIIASLSLRHQIERKLDASITIARADIPVVSLGKKLGFEELSASKMHNVSVGLIACFQPKPYPKDDVNFWAEYYWTRRHEMWAGEAAIERRTA